MGRPPRVLVDATAIPPDRGGVGRYVDNLVVAAAQITAERGGDLLVVCQSPDAERFAAVSPHPEVIAAPGLIRSRAARLAWEQTGLPLLVRRVRADVVHSPHYTMPLAAGRPVVVTVHDATFFTEPQAHTPVKRRFFTAATRLAVRRGARVVVPSQATKDELVRLLGADPRRIDVARHGVDHDTFRPPTAAERERAAKNLGLDVPYIAFLGTLEPRKNLANLVRGWVRAVRDRDDPPALVLAGGPGWDTDLDRAAASVPAHLRLLRPGYLPLDDLRGFLGGAALVAYPSLGEGFGLPVLEAMACGAPVLTTRRLSLPEVGGAAVAYTEPSAAAIADALRALLDDPARARQLSTAAIKRAAGFTWSASAEVHAASWAAACEQAGPRGGAR